MTVQSILQPTLSLNSAIAQPCQKIGVMVVGDSIGAGTAEGDIVTTFENEFKKYNIDASIVSASQGGKKLITDFVNGTFDGIGAEYTDEITNKGATVLDTITDVIINLGTNDIGAVAAGTYTKANFKTSLQFLVNYLFADTDLPNLQRIHIRPLGRHTTQASLGYQTAMQDITEAIIEVCDETANVFLGAPYYDLEFADNVHPTSASYETLVARDAVCIAFRIGNYGRDGSGVPVNSAITDDTGMLINLTAGDITVPASGIEAVRIFDGATEISYDEFEKVDNNTVRLKAGAPIVGSDLKVITRYGSLYDLGTGTGNTIQDERGYPLKPATVAVSEPTDPILQLTDLKYYMKPSMEKTFTAGTNISGIKSVNGGTFTALNNDFDFDSAAFSGSGGLVGTNANSELRGDNDLMDMVGGGFMIGLVVDVQANGHLFALGSQSFGSHSGAFFGALDGDLKSFRYTGATAPATIASSVVTYETGIIGEKLSLILDCPDAATFNLYVNSESNVYTADPRDNDFIGWSTFFLNATSGNTDNIFGLTWGKDSAHNASNDPSITNLMTFMNNWKNGN